MNNKKKIEVAFSPILYKYFDDKDAIVVVIDVLRATSAICTAFNNGVKKLIPVGTVKEARDFKNNGYMVAAERDGVVLDFADFGNSPFNFTKGNIKDKTIAYSTTNGTQAINIAKNSHEVIIGSFLNLDTVCKYITEKNKDVILLCAGWKNKFNIEDTICAGAIIEKLFAANQYETICDSANASIELWSVAKHDIVNFIEKAAQRHRLKRLGLDDVIEYCHTPNLCNVLPILKDGYLVDKLIDNTEKC
ncbi:MAG: 2-phosphosulfolactate phosphatase [Bacteroidales bacterium]|nr:2-phosphosulfolactate phosphatase [Bacteroidales bacterium]